MSAFRLESRVRDILDAIEMLLENRTFDMLSNDRVGKAAFERFVEIISEASRHIPGEIKKGSLQILNDAVLRVMARLQQPQS